MNLSISNIALLHIIEQHKKRWKEHPEECPAEINSMSEEEAYEGIWNCTFLNTKIPGEARAEFVKRLKKRTKKQVKSKKDKKKKQTEKQNEQAD